MPAAPTPPAAHRAAAAAPFGLVVLVGLLAWWGVWNFGYKFDDLTAIVENEALARGDWWAAAFGARHQPLANRPFTTWSLAIGASWMGPGPLPALLGNLLLHLVNGMLVLAITRAALTSGNLAGRLPSSAAARVALTLACVFVAHPLATDTVAYATQRSTALGSACLLLSLLALARGAAAARPGRWHAVAALSMALAAASKEDFVGGPFLAVLFDRAFLQPSWRAVRAHAGAHAAIAAACWATLAGCVALGPQNDTVGFATAEGITAWQWLLTQTGVVLHYARLALWPAGQRGFYDWDFVTTTWAAALPGLGCLALLALTAWSWRRRPHWGFLGALFFVYLAPTSSVLPIVTEVVAERRAYLPMLALLAPAVLGGRLLLRRIGGGPAALGGAVLTVLGLAVATRSHAATYRDATSFWQRAYDQRDPAARNTFTTRLVGSYAAGRFAAGDEATAHRLFDEVLTLPSPTAAERLQCATSLHRRGRHQEALAIIDQLIAETPGLARAHGMRGTFLAREAERVRAAPDAPQWEQAARSSTRATELAPTQAVWWVELARIRDAQGRLDAAERAVATAAAMPDCPTGVLTLHDALLRRLSRSRDAEALWQTALARRSGDVEVWIAAAQAAISAKDPALARERLLAARRLAPGRADIDSALARLPASTPR